MVRAGPEGVVVDVSVMLDSRYAYISGGGESGNGTLSWL